MRLFRFMSIDEFNKYVNGKKLINNTNHHKENNQKTNSIGFCFLNLDEYKPEEALHFLTGIVNFSICAVFETNNENVRRTKGRYNILAKASRPTNVYANYFELLNSEYNGFIANEYCTTKYSKDNFKLIKYTIPDWFNQHEWKWIKESDKINKEVM